LHESSDYYGRAQVARRFGQLLRQFYCRHMSRGKVCTVFQREFSAAPRSTTGPPFPRSLTLHIAVSTDIFLNPLPDWLTF
jgi:hypothetical protein